MIFKDREDAGQRLIHLLQAYASANNVVVLGIPRGGVPVAFEIARGLHAPLDVFLSRKLGVPGREELAFGAVAAGDGRFLDEQIIQAAGISEMQIENITRATQKTLEERSRLYRGTVAPLQVEGQVVILVDDGIATGASIFAAIRALRQKKPAKLVVAAPVAPLSTCAWLRTAADELVVTYAPDEFEAVGQFYENFAQVSDEEVVELLRRAEQLSSLDISHQAAQTSDQPAKQDREQEWECDHQEVSIAVGQSKLGGILSLPRSPRGIVLFAHGSGSSRTSPRNRYVAEVLQSKGLATLLFDLLTNEEESIDRGTSKLRFDIPLLAGRLVDVTQWATRNTETRNLAVGYFGASTGAAAALVAAARLPGLVDAIVSRGGRPDLAGEDLGFVQAPTLLIVGGLDDVVLGLNRRALDQLRGPSKRLAIVPNATHLFEEPGTLEEAARLAAEWLVQYVGQARRESKMTASSVAKLAGS